jgi:SAM-dependent methyltransferase
MGDDITMRGAFDAQAAVYDRVRPHYPEALFDALVKEARLPGGARLVEIGAGTGQATLPLARRGYHITAIELGSHMVALLRRQLQDYPKVKIVAGAFEDAPLPEASFDLVYAATALHWVRPDRRFAKPHEILKPGGHLAIIQTNHVSDEQGDVFFHATQPLYDKYMPSADGEFRLPLAKDIQPLAQLQAKLFKLTYFAWFPLVVEYSAQEYVQLLGTYSPHLALKPAVRTAFYTELQRLIDDQFGGKVAKHYAMALTLRQRV